MAEIPDIELPGDGAEDDDLTQGAPLSFNPMDADSLAPLFFTVLFLSVIVGITYVLSIFIADAVISFILLGLFGKLHRFILRHVSSNRFVASGLVTSVIIVVILLPLSGFLYSLALEANSAFQRLSAQFQDGGQGVLELAVAWGRGNGVELTTERIRESIGALALGANETVMSYGSTLFGSILNLGLHSAIILVMTFYLFADGDRLRRFLFRLSPLPDDEDAMLIATFQKVSHGVIVGNGLGSAIQGLLGGIAMWAAGLHSPLLWGVVMTVFAFLPLIGITIVVIPAALFLVVQGRIGEALAFFGFCFVMSLFVENVVKTKLMGSAMMMHDLLVFLSIIGGLAAFGVIGFLYGPLIAMLFITLHGLYESHYLPRLARSLARRRGV
jgi:predicted PurR-regulated permease PerM